MRLWHPVARRAADPFGQRCHLEKPEAILGEITARWRNELHDIKIDAVIAIAERNFVRAHLQEAQELCCQAAREAQQAAERGQALRAEFARQKVAEFELRQQVLREYLIEVSEKAEQVQRRCSELREQLAAESWERLKRSTDWDDSEVDRHVRAALSEPSTAEQRESFPAIAARVKPRVDEAERSFEERIVQRLKEIRHEREHDPPHP